MATEVRLPELGEGVERADVVRVLVAPGDTVAIDQPLLEIETDKATVEVPSPIAGTVAALAVEAASSPRSNPTARRRMRTRTRRRRM